MNDRTQPDPLVAGDPLTWTPEPDLLAVLTDTSSPGVARRALRTLLGTRAASPFGERVLLASSELMNNALMHTSGECFLSAWFPAPHACVRVEVVDASPAWPPTRSTPPTVGGRGLTIVDSVVDRWGFVGRPPGKVVWFEIDDADAAGHDA